jgi:hypothetical protein
MQKPAVLARWIVFIGRRFGLRWYEKGDGRREEDGVRSTQCAGKKSKK